MPFKRTQRYFNGKEILDKLHKCIPSKLCFLYSTDPIETNMITFVANVFNDADIIFTSIFYFKSSANNTFMHRYGQLPEKQWSGNMVEIQNNEFVKNNALTKLPNNILEILMTYYREHIYKAKGGKNVTRSSYESRTKDTLIILAKSKRICIKSKYTKSDIIKLLRHQI